MRELISIIEKIYNRTRPNSPRLNTHFRTDRVLHTAMPDGCNVNIKGVGNIHSPENSDVKVMHSFNTSHGMGNYHCFKIKQSK